MATKKTTAKASNNDDLQKQIEDLKNTVALLANALSATKATADETKVVETKVNDIESIDIEEETYETIPDNKNIKVISLQNNPMTLSTEGYGRGKLYDFNTFGQSKTITYANLSDILYNNESFAKDGRFYVCDKTVVKNHELTDTYKTILTKEQIENILTYDNGTITELFTRTSNAQRDTIVSLIVTKLNNGEKLDLNKVSVISNLYGFDIVSGRSK